MTLPSTIFALSSGRQLPAAIAVVRVSGPQARLALEKLAGRVPEPRRAAFARIKDPDTGETIDEGLALFFPGPKSETGEDMVELHLHGGRAVVAATLAALGRLPGFRPAEAGEFTRRAFLNGKLDLTAVEGLADLVAAETEAQRKQAYRQLSGALGRRAEGWRTKLVEALALTEARIDFSEEEVPENLLARALEKGAALRAEIAAVLADEGRGERLREGFTVAIAGPPNAGKSSLFNALAKREAAIVTAVPGTTRDVLEVHLDLDGYPVTLLDTAGIRHTDDPVEQEGVRRARERAAAADLVLWVVDSTTARSEEQFSTPEGAWVIRNKIDLVDPASLPPARSAAPEFRVSAKVGDGVADVVSAVSRGCKLLSGSLDDVLITRERHRRALQDTEAALHRALAVNSGEAELIAEELHLAAGALGRLAGRVDVDDVLDVIFRDFCIGK
jgi:tRNA modification GTPase